MGKPLDDHFRLGVLRLDPGHYPGSLLFIRGDAGETPCPYPTRSLPRWASGPPTSWCSSISAAAVLSTSAPPPTTRRQCLGHPAGPERGHVVRRRRHQAPVSGPRRRHQVLRPAQYDLENRRGPGDPDSPPRTPSEFLRRVLDFLSKARVSRLLCLFQSWPTGLHHPHVSPTFQRRKISSGPGHRQ